jgi:hypothetical protein
MPNLIVYDGAPGVGKTTFLLNDSEGWQSPWAVTTYNRASADELTKRGLSGPAATIYSLSFPHVKAMVKQRKNSKSTQAWRHRAIQDQADPALEQYVKTAPSRKATNLRLELLHAWDPSQGSVPAWVWDSDSALKSGEQYAVGLARWLDKGAPWAEGFTGYATLAIDEAQDMSQLELAAAMALVRENGTVLAVGDPGQSLYLEVKGMEAGDQPPAWQHADELRTLEGGWRIGYPAAAIAANVLRPYYDRPAQVFAADAPTNVHVWDELPPCTGMVLGFSRQSVANYIEQHDLRRAAVSPSVANAQLWVETIHQAKGAEADDVYLLPWSGGALERLAAEHANAIKVLYVAITRARKNLFLSPELFAHACHGIL